jgi:hypothetical protein
MDALAIPQNAALAAAAPETARRTRAPLPPLARVTLACLLGSAGLLAGVQAFMFHGIIPPIAVFAALQAAAAVPFALRLRWAPLPAVILAVMQVMMQGPFFAGLLMRMPDDQLPPIAILLGLSLVMAIAGAAALAQSYRRTGDGRRAPRWLAPLVASVAGLSAGVAMLGAMPRPGLAATVSPDVMRGMPALAAEHHAFVQREIHVRAGQTVALRLENRDGASHVFDVDALGIHAPMPGHQATVAVFRAPPTPGRLPFYCGPHFDRATGHGMHGVLVVDP